MTTGRKIVSNIFYFFLDFLTVTLAGYMFWVLMGRMLTPAQYGVLTAVLAVFYVLSTITALGLIEALPKTVSHLLAKGKPESAGGVVRYSFKLATASGIVIGLGLWLSAGWLSQALYGSTAMAAPLQMLSVLLLAANVGLVAKAGLQGLQNFRAMFFADVVGNIGKLVVAVILVALGWSAMGGIVAWTVYFVVLAAICAFVALSSRLPSGPFDRRTLWAFSCPSMLSMLAYYLIIQGGVLMLTLLSSAQVVGFFGVAVLFGQVLMFVPSVIAGAIFPNLSEMWVTSKEKVQHLLAASLKLTVLAMLPFTILLITDSQVLIQLIYGAAYLPAAAAFPAFMFGSFMFGLVSLMLITLYAIDRPKTRLGIFVTGAGINIGLCYALIPSVGMAGAALAFMASQIAMLAASLIVVGRHVPLHFSIRSLIIIPIALLFGALLTLHNYAPELWLKALIAVAAFAVYALALLATRVVNRSDLLLLEFFPDRFGFGAIKRTTRRMIALFE